MGTRGQCCAFLGGSHQNRGTGLSSEAGRGMPPLPLPCFHPQAGLSCGVELCCSLPRGRGRKDEMRSCFLHPFSHGGRNPAAGCRWKNKNAPTPLCKRLTCCSPAQTPHNCPPQLSGSIFFSISEGASPPLKPASAARGLPAPLPPRHRAAPLLPGGHENWHLLQDFVVLDGLLQVLQVGVDAADGAHVGLQQLNVPFLQQAGHGGVCKKESAPRLHATRPEPSAAVTRPVPPAGPPRCRTAAEPRPRCPRAALQPLSSPTKLFRCLVSRQARPTLPTRDPTARQPVLVSAGTELIVFLLAAAFWISYENNVHNTYGFSCC